MSVFIEEVVGDVDIDVGFFDVVEVIEGVEEFDDLEEFFFAEFDFIGRHVDETGVGCGDSGGIEGIVTGVKVADFCNNGEGLPVIDDIGGTGFEGSKGDGFFVALLFADANVAAVVELPGDGSVFAEDSAVFAECVAEFGDGSVAIFGIDFDEDSDSSVGFPFVEEFFVVFSFDIAGASGDCSVDVVFWEGCFFGFFDSDAESRISCGIGSAHFCGDDNFTREFGEELAPNGILLAFSDANVFPFTVPSHR